MCRTKLPLGPEQLFEKDFRLYFPLTQLMERSGGSGARLAIAQCRMMDKVPGVRKGTATQEHAYAQYHLDFMYRDGRELPQSEKVASV